MTKEEALKKIKTLRDEINNIHYPDGKWVNLTVYYLDLATDTIEFSQS